MNITELYKPKINSKVTDVAHQYYTKRNNYEFPVFMDGIRWLNEKLSKMGWAPLNSGAYSRVYQNPKKKYVLKITTYQDNGYAEFVNITRKFKNKHFPKISDQKDLVINISNEEVAKFSLYLIEKLKVIPVPYGDNYAHFIHGIISISYEQGDANITNDFIMLTHPPMEDMLVEAAEEREKAAAKEKKEIYEEAKKDPSLMQKLVGSLGKKK